MDGQPHLPRNLRTKQFMPLLSMGVPKPGQLLLKDARGNPEYDMFVEHRRLAARNPGQTRDQFCFVKRRVRINDNNEALGTIHNAAPNEKYLVPIIRPRNPLPAGHRGVWTHMTSRIVINPNYVPAGEEDTHAVLPPDDEIESIGSQSNTLDDSELEFLSDST
jgi:hypothetical protein